MPRRYLDQKLKLALLRLADAVAELEGIEGQARTPREAGRHPRTAHARRAHAPARSGRGSRSPTGRRPEARYAEVTA